MGREARVGRRWILVATASAALAAFALFAIGACGIDLVGAPTQDDDLVSQSDGGDERPDARRDGSLDVAASETGSDGCPEVCDECSGGVCRIACSGATCEGTTITCPAGMSCRVECSEKGACNKTTIECPEDRGCSVLCSEEACTNADIRGGSAQYLCVECRGNGGAPGCDGLSCSSPGAERCRKVCGRDSCRGMSGCGECPDFFFCP